MASDPLEVLDMRLRADTGKRVMVQCREPSGCMVTHLYGYTAVVNAAVEQLEAIHQSAHALKVADNP